MEQTDPPTNVGSTAGLGRMVPDAMVERLRTERDLCAAEHADDIANLLHEAVLHITTLEQDAARYRWLARAPLWTCALNQWSGPSHRQYIWATQFSAPLHEENGGLDAALDAAMAQEQCGLTSRYDNLAKSRPPPSRKAQPLGARQHAGCQAAQASSGRCAPRDAGCSTAPDPR